MRFLVLSEAKNTVTKAATDEINPLPRAFAWIGFVTGAMRNFFKKKDAVSDSGWGSAMGISGSNRSSSGMVSETHT